MALNPFGTYGGTIYQGRTAQEAMLNYNNAIAQQRWAMNSLHGAAAMNMFAEPPKLLKFPRDAYEKARVKERRMQRAEDKVWRQRSKQAGKWLWYVCLLWGAIAAIAITGLMLRGLLWLSLG